MRLLAPAAAVLAAHGASAQLHRLAVAAGKMYFGSATDNGELNDAAYVRILTDRNEFGQITPGNGQKWQFTQPSRGSFSYSSGDQIANLAKTNNMILRCHTLVWHSQLPSWGTSAFFFGVERHRMLTWTQGQCYAWDVVNEALNEDGTFRRSVFYDVLGESFIPIAFKAAAAADPGAKLYYNDYNIESTGAKQAGTVRIVDSIKRAGGRIDGVGMQAHLIVGSTPSQSSLEATMNSYLAAGASEVAYTELDIRFSSLPPTAAGLRTQADNYATVTRACLAVDACVGITIWDFTDKYSWIPSVFPGQGAALLYDENFSKKPAWTAVSSVLAAAATGGPAPTTTLTTVTTTTRTGAPAPTCTAAKWAQCGGSGWTGCTVCAAGSTCQRQNDWYSQCL
ncbi:hypothetical protein DL767_007891 [Monosporascus sp. MG133]|nr:hypothetical protein DL767_007891 [Monosporascus sp. MG133]